MTYVEGFVAAVPTARKDAYLTHARTASEMIMGIGAARMVEAWGDDVPRGQVTDFYRTVKAKDDETVVFSWFEYPDRAARDAANERMMADPRMEEMAKSMPFDGSRMIWGGFDAFVDKGSSAKGSYIDGYLVPVLPGQREAYAALAGEMAEKLIGWGATRVVEAWGDDLPAGKVTDYKGAVQAGDGEGIVYSYVEWPDKATRDAGWAEMMKEEVPPAEALPFDGKRMLWGGFVPILDLAAETADA